MAPECFGHRIRSQESHGVLKGTNQNIKTSSVHKTLLLNCTSDTLLVEN